MKMQLTRRTIFTWRVSPSSLPRGFREQPCCEDIRDSDSHHRIHTHGAPGGSGEHLPIRVEFLESERTVHALMPKLIQLVTDGVIEVQATSIAHIVQVSQTRHREDKNA